jgi:hypothetical protein
LIIALRTVQSKIKDHDKNHLRITRLATEGGGLGNEVTEHLVRDPDRLPVSALLAICCSPAATTLNFGEIWAVMGMRIGNLLSRCRDVGKGMCQGRVVVRVFRSVDQVYQDVVRNEYFLGEARATSLQHFKFRQCNCDLSV